MASPRPWPFDDEDRPSGSVRPLSQADLQAILAHLDDDDPDGLLAGTIGDRPVVAVRVRASVGRPGGSAQAQWRRLRAAEWTAWTRTLPWRAAATLGIGAAGGLLGSLLAPRLGLVVAALAAVAPAGGCGSSPARTPSPGDRVRQGSGAPPGCWLRWSDTGGRSCTTWPSRARQANIDHLVIGPGGVFVIDSKQYRGRLQLDAVWEAVAWPPSPRPYLGAVSWEADQAAQALPDPGVAVVPIVAVHGAQVPWGKVVTDGVPVVAARRLPSMLRALPAVLGPERVAWLADQARVRFHAAD